MKCTRRPCVGFVAIGLLLQAACGDAPDKDRASAGFDGGTQQLDASHPNLDASADTGRSIDPSCRLDQRYRFSSGDLLRDEIYELTPDGRIRSLWKLPDGGVMTACETMLPGCTGPTDSGVSTGELSAAFLKSDVVAAFSDDPRPLWRVLDFHSSSTNREIVREDGKRILVGLPCSGSACDSVAPELRNLMDLTRLLGRSSLLLFDPTTGFCRF